MMNGWQHTDAFVIQFQAETDVRAGRFEGRVEHVASSRSAHFHSLDEMLSFLAQTLADVRTDDNEHAIFNSRDVPEQTCAANSAKKGCG